MLPALAKPFCLLAKVSSRRFAEKVRHEVPDIQDKLVHKELLHITIARVYIDSTDFFALAEAVSGIKLPFVVKYSGAVYWPNNTLAIKIEQNKVVDTLRAKLKNNLGDEKFIEPKKFCPHVTLSRSTGKPSGKKSAAILSSLEGRFFVNELYLSDGKVKLEKGAYYSQVDNWQARK